MITWTEHKDSPRGRERFGELFEGRIAWGEDDQLGVSVYVYRDGPNGHWRVTCRFVGLEAVKVAGADDNYAQAQRGAVLAVAEGARTRARYCNDLNKACGQ